MESTTTQSGTAAERTVTMTSSEFHCTTDDGVREVITISGESVNAVWNAFRAEYGLTHRVSYVRDLNPQVALVRLAG